MQICVLMLLCKPCIIAFGILNDYITVHISNVNNEAI